MKVITEENEELKRSQNNINLIKIIEKEKKDEQKPIIVEKKMAFIPDSKLLSPKIRGFSPKYYHEMTTKKIDDDKRTGFYHKIDINYKFMIICL